MQNVILTFLVGGWVLRELELNFDVAKCSNITESSYLCPKHIFRFPKLTNNFNAVLQSNLCWAKALNRPTLNFTIGM